MDATRITQILDQYCLARAKKDGKLQLEIANRLVDEVIPDLFSQAYPDKQWRTLE